MKVPLSLLNNYLDLKHLSLEEIAKTLTLGGIEVESIDRIGPSFTGVVVAQVIDSKPHPHADHLSIATVFDGTETLQIVCGAPNCRAGIKTALAKIGAVLMDEQDKPFKIKKSKFREIESNGMLCSALELKIGTSDEGILEFPEEMAVGIDLRELHTHTVFDVSLTPNLGHAFSIYGIARELSALLNLPLKSTPIVLKEEGEPIEKGVRVQVIDQRRAPRYACRIVTDVQVGPSPESLKRQVEACGMQSINNVVDCGNLVMLLLGQPLHLFDLDTIADHSIIVTAETEFKELETLDGTLRALPPSALLICDSEKPLAIAGIMGGKNSGVTEKTQRILIEAAHFTPVGIRQTSKLLGLKSEAAQHFEKGTDPNALFAALDLAASLLQQYAGAKVAKGVIDRASHPFTPKKIACRPERVNQILGTHLSESEMTGLLSRLEMEILEESGNQFLVAVPTYRNDIKEEIDLIEEIARLYGYNLLPKVLSSPRELSPLSTPLFTP